MASPGEVMDLHSVNAGLPGKQPSEEAASTSAAVNLLESDAKRMGSVMARIREDQRSQNQQLPQVLGPNSDQKPVSDKTPTAALSS